MLKRISMKLNIFVVCRSCLLMPVMFLNKIGTAGQCKAVPIL